MDTKREEGSASDAASVDYAFLREDWSSKWASTRNLVAMLFTMTVFNAPGLFWLYSLVEQLRTSDAAYWFAPTPSNQTSIVAQNAGAIVLSVLWFGIVFAMFGRPLLETVREFRR
ncbi:MULTISPECIES: hypothetical protein [Halorussus]|uniref:hypothetical protein n=1 Tax=Halorussus TaxID=1070314 RepID=UPI00209CB47C|nr:hypothetical protein [Halorussus vallis]USZ74751.1 hypothetical protein NGM07_15070 [Halorussus vallis]